MSELKDMYECKVCGYSTLEGQHPITECIDNIKREKSALQSQIDALKIPEEVINGIDLIVGTVWNSDFTQFDRFTIALNIVNSWLTEYRKKVE